MRGAVSLAAALALPIDVRFPQRDLVIFLTFCVILATLVGQGLTLPALIRRLGLSAATGPDTEETHARLAAVDAALARLTTSRTNTRAIASWSTSCAPATSTRPATSGRTATARATRTSRSGSTTSRSGRRSSTPSARRSSGCATTGSSATRCCTASSATSTSKRCAAASEAAGLAVVARRGAGRASLPDHEHRRRRALPVHLRIGDRGPSRQDVRPGLRRHPRRDHPRGPERPGRVRDGDHDRPGHGPRRDHDDDLHRHPGGRPRHGPRHRLHPGRLRLRLPDLRHADLGQGAVARHRPGRRRRARGPRRRGLGVRAGRRRPGDDVRLRLPRDAGADAAADRPGPPDGAAPGRGPQVRPAAVPPPGRQDPGHRRVRARRPEAGPHGRRRPPSTTRTSGPSGSATTSSRRSSCRRSRPTCARPIRSCTSTRPAGSSPAARWATPA